VGVAYLDVSWRVWQQIHEAIILAETDEVVKNHYKNLNVICTKKAFIAFVLHIVR
jgi:hypothetical protein